MCDESQRLVFEGGGTIVLRVDTIWINCVKTIVLRILALFNSLIKERIIRYEL